MSDLPSEAAKFQINEEFPSQKEILNESFEGEDQRTPEELRSIVADFWKLPAPRQNKYIKNFSNICQKLGPEDLWFVVEHFYSLDKKLVTSRPEVAGNLCANLEILFKVMAANPGYQEGTPGRSKTEKHILGFLGILIGASSFNLAPVSRSALVRAGPLFSKDNANNELLSIILSLLHDQVETNKTAALELLKKLNTLFSEEYIRGFIAMDIIALLQSPSVNIRIEATNALFSLFDHFTRDFVETRFLPVIEGLARDPNNTVVNHLIKNMPALARKISFNQFEQFFFPKFIEYLNSKNRFQKEEALLVLGEMVLSLTESEDESHVFSVYSSQHLERLLETYFDLPKVIAKMNLVTKKAIIKANYELLSRIVVLRKTDMWARVKKLILSTEELESVLIESAKLEISSRLDAIAKVCDKLTLEKDLIVIIDKFYLTVGPSTSQSVKQNTIKILGEVLKELREDIREKYADVYQTTLNLEANKWRLRYVISEQIDTLSKLFKPETVFEKIIPMYFAFCRDNCAVVRKSASRLFYKLYQNVSGNEGSKNILLVNLRSFGIYKRFVLRQSFVLMAESVLLNVKDWHDDEVTDALLQLSLDPVVNVRLTVARLVVSLTERGLEKEFVAKAKKNLLKDVDQDLFSILKPAFPGDEFGLLQAAFENRKNLRLAAAVAEKARVDAIRMSKGMRVSPSRVANLNVSNVSNIAANAYRQLLQNAFDLSDNPNAKELLEDLELSNPPPKTEEAPQPLLNPTKVEEKTAEKEPETQNGEVKEEQMREARRQAHLEPFVELEIQDAPVPQQEEVEADHLAHELPAEVKTEAAHSLEQLTQEVNIKMPTPEEVAVAKETADSEEPVAGDVPTEETTEDTTAQETVVPESQKAEDESVPADDE